MRYIVLCVWPWSMSEQFLLFIFLFFVAYLFFLHLVVIDHFYVLFIILPQTTCVTINVIILAWPIHVPSIFVDFNIKLICWNITLFKILIFYITPLWFFMSWSLWDTWWKWIKTRINFKLLFVVIDWWLDTSAELFLYLFHCAYLVTTDGVWSHLINILNCVVLSLTINIFLLALNRFPGNTKIIFLYFWHPYSFSNFWNEFNLFIMLFLDRSVTMITS